MGCYQNAFATIRACYDAWQRPATHPFKTWQDAFLPQRQITLMERDGVGAPPAWSGWNFPGFIPYPGEPGDPSPLSPVPFATALFAAEPPHAVPSSPHKTETPAPPSPATGPMSAQDANVRRMAERMKDVRVPPRAAPSYHKAIQALSDAIGSPIDRARVQALQAIQASQHDLVSLKLEDTLRTPNAPEAATALDSFAQSASRWVILANLGLAIGYGYLRDIFMQGEDAYDALNDQDFRAWLKTCLATDESLNSAPVRAIYDLAFAFRMGNASSLDNGSMAAGVTLRFVLELVFGYKDAPLWRMAAGTGDTVFVPFYQVLLARGASIQFFHRVTELRPTSDGSLVGEIEISKQAATVGGATYQPLTRVGDLDCWPNQPNWSQLQNGQPPSVLPPDYYEFELLYGVGRQHNPEGRD